MICPDCGKRMRCIDTVNSRKKLFTARRYKCGECDRLLHTLEAPYDKNKVNYLMSERNRKYYGRGRKRDNES